MKKYFLFLALTVALFAFAPTTEVYKVDVNKSKVEWTGRKVTGSHNGEIKLASGQLNVQKNKLNGGKLIMNMSSISNHDLSGEYAAKLLGHLKSDDFFAVDKNPEAQFIITSVKHSDVNKATITGNMIIKGISNPISFPANIQQKNDVLVAVANGVKINRTKYNIKYNSKSFIDGLGDKAIDDDFELNITVVARK